MSSTLLLHTSCTHMQGQRGGSLKWPALCTLRRAVNCTSHLPSPHQLLVVPAPTPLHRVLAFGVSACDTAEPHPITPPVWRSPSSACMIRNTSPHTAITSPWVITGQLAITPPASYHLTSLAMTSSARMLRGAAADPAAAACPCSPPLPAGSAP